MKIMDEVRSGAQIDFLLYEYSSLRFDNCLCVPNDSNLKKKILEEAHHSIYAVHPGNTKMT